MKTIINLIIVLFYVSVSFGQQSLPYQAILRDSDGKPVQNTQIQLRFSIKNQAQIVRYQETQAPITDGYGWFEVLIGTGTPVSGSMANVDWSNDTNTLVMECSEDGGGYQEVSSVIISGSPFTFSGDNNPGNDITVGSAAGGDLEGTYPNPTVIKINGKPVSTNMPNQGEVLKWNGSEWTPSLDLTSSGGGGNDGVLSVSSGQGIEVNNADPKNPVIINKGDLSNVNEIQTLSVNANQLSISQGNSITLPSGDNWGSEAVNHNNTLSGDGKANSPLIIAQQGAQLGQVLKWNNVSWVPADDTGADNWGTQVIQKTATLDGDGTTANPLKIAAQGASTGQVLKYNASTQTWAPSNESGADNWGTQVVQKTSRITGDGTANSPIDLAQQNATNGQVLKWNGSSWAPSTDSGADNWGTQVVQKTSRITGDGTANSPIDLAQQNATNGQVLKWNGSSWAPSTDSGADNWGTQVIQKDITLEGDGTTASPLKLAVQGATSGQVLVYNPPNGTTSQSWVPQTLNVSPWTTSGNTIFYNSGNVGIGANSPSEKLEVNGKIKVTSEIIVGTVSILGSSNGLDINENVRPTVTGTFNLGSSSRVWQNTYSSNVYLDKLYFNPSVALTDVSTGITLSGNFAPAGTNTYNIGNSSNRWATIYSQNALNTPSDRRLKSDIKDLSYGLSTILALQPKSYYYTNDESKKPKLGLIAQEVQNIIPEIVSGDESKEMLSMSYEYLIPVLINAVKEQQKIIEDMQALIVEGRKLQIEMKAELTELKEGNLKSTASK